MKNKIRIMDFIIFGLLVAGIVFFLQPVNVFVRAGGLYFSLKYIVLIAAIAVYLLYFYVFAFFVLKRKRLDIVAVFFISTFLGLCKRVSKAKTAKSKKTKTICFFTGAGICLALIAVFAFIIPPTGAVYAGIVLAVVVLFLTTAAVQSLVTPAYAGVPADIIAVEPTAIADAEDFSVTLSAEAYGQGQEPSAGYSEAAFAEAAATAETQPVQEQAEPQAAVVQAVATTAIADAAKAQEQAPAPVSKPTPKTSVKTPKTTEHAESKPPKKNVSAPLKQAKPDTAAARKTEPTEKTAVSEKPAESVKAKAAIKQAAEKDGASAVKKAPPKGGAAKTQSSKPKKDAAADGEAKR